MLEERRHTPLGFREGFIAHDGAPGLPLAPLFFIHAGGAREFCFATCRARHFASRAVCLPPRYAIAAYNARTLISAMMRTRCRRER